MSIFEPSLFSCLTSNFRWLPLRYYNLIPTAQCLSIFVRTPTQFKKMWSHFCWNFKQMLPSFRFLVHYPWHIYFTYFLYRSTNIPFDVILEYHKTAFISTFRWNWSNQLKMNRLVILFWFLLLGSILKIHIKSASVYFWWKCCVGIHIPSRFDTWDMEIVNLLLNM